MKHKRKNRTRIKKKYKMNRYKNCREIDPMIPSNPNELSDIEKCADNIEAIDNVPIDETNPSLYYALTEPSRPDINPRCISKQNYINLPIKTENDSGNPPYFRRNPFTNTHIRCNEIDKLEEPYDYDRRQIYRNEGSMTIYYSTKLELIHTIYDVINKTKRISKENEDNILYFLKNYNINLNQNFDLLHKSRPGSDTLLPIEKQFKFLTLFQAIILFRQDKLLKRIFAEYPHVNILSYHQLFLQDNDEYRYKLPQYLIKSQTYHNILSLLFYNNISDKNNEDRVINILKLIKNNLYEEDFEELFQSQKIKIEIKTKDEINEFSTLKNKLEIIISGAGNERLQSIIIKKRRMNPLTDEEEQILIEHERTVAPQKEKLKNIINKYDYKYNQLPLKTLKLHSDNNKIIKKVESIMTKMGLSTNFSINLQDLTIIFSNPINISQSLNKSNIRIKLLSNLINNRIQNNNNLNDEIEAENLLINILKNLHIDAIITLISSRNLLLNLKDNEGFDIKDKLLLLILNNFPFYEIEPLWKHYSVYDTKLYTTNEAIKKLLLENLERVFEVKYGENRQYEKFIEAIIFKIQDIQEENKDLMIKNYLNRYQLSYLQKSNLENLSLLEEEYIDFLKYIVSIADINPGFIIDDENNRKKNKSYYNLLTIILAETITFRHIPKRGYEKEKIRPLPSVIQKIRYINNYGREYTREKLHNPYIESSKYIKTQQFKLFPYDTFTSIDNSLTLKQIFENLAKKENLLFTDIKKIDLQDLIGEFIPSDTNPEVIFKKLYKKSKLITELILYGLSDSIDRSRYSLFLHEGMIETPEDGDCFFHSLSGLIKSYYNTDISHTKLRKIVVAKLKKIIENKIPGLEDSQTLLISMQSNVPDKKINNFEDYYTYMNKKGNWATELEIIAASHLLGRRILLRTERKGVSDIIFPHNLTDSFSNQSPLVIYHISLYGELEGNHYTYRERQDNEQISDLPQSFINNMDSTFNQGSMTINSNKKIFTIPISNNYINPKEYSIKIQNFMSNTDLNNRIYVSNTYLKNLTLQDLIVLCQLYNLDLELCKTRRASGSVNKVLKDDVINNIITMLKELFEIIPKVEEKNENENLITSSNRSSRIRKLPDRLGEWSK